MVIAISQPTLYPWIGYFDIINKCGQFVFLDDVQLNRRSWQTRNRVKDPASEKEIWLNIPIMKSTLDTLIKDAKIDNSKDWKKQHIKTLTACYGKNFENLSWLQELYSKTWDFLAQFNMEFIKQCCKYLDIKTEFLISSDINVEGKKAAKLINICKSLSADTYLTTVGAKENYTQEEKNLFKKNNIEIQYHNYTHQTYNQKGKQFVPYLSILDLILNLGEESKKIFIL